MTSTAKRFCVERQAPAAISLRWVARRENFILISFTGLGVFPSLGKRRCRPMRLAPTCLQVLKARDCYMKAPELAGISRVRRERLILTNRVQYMYVTPFSGWLGSRKTGPRGKQRNSPGRCRQPLIRRQGGAPKGADTPRIKTF
jgi:hypothetical protein